MNAPSLRWEKKLWREGYEFVAGVDEAGRGPLAGPVTAAAVIFPPHFNLSGLKDSKLLNPSQRLHCYRFIQETALAFAYAVVSHAVIDKINILQASLLAMKEAVAQLKVKPDYLLVDGRDRVKVGLPQQAVIKGDLRVASIAAAGIVAKVVRDNIMFEYHRQYRAYGFARHKGYGTAEHLRALAKYGPCAIHRRSFAPLTNASGIARIIHTKERGR